jgi:hypothetical protein
MGDGTEPPQVPAGELVKVGATQTTRALPRVEAALTKAGLSPIEITLWLSQLAPMSLSEDEILALIKDQQEGHRSSAPGTRAIVRRQITLWRHSLSHWWHHKKLTPRLLYAAAWLTILASATFKAGLGAWGWFCGAVVLIMKARAVMGEYDPKHMPLMRKTMTERHLLLNKLIHTMQLWRDEPPTPREREQFQGDVLRLIALFVRDHRADLKGKMIFSNLIIRRGDKAIVIARSDSMRPVPVTYSREQCSIAWAAMDRREPVCTGDVYADAPQTSPGKRYNSVLAMPISLDKQVLGAVSVDSEAKYHFDMYLDEIANALAPYVQLLAVTLDEDHDRPALLPDGHPGQAHRGSEERS